MTFNRIAPFVALFAIFAVLQLALIGLDCIQTPASVAKAFAKDYYYLDADMQKWLSMQDGDTQTVVGDFLYGKEKEAADRGFAPNRLRRMFTSMHVTTEHVEDNTASVHIKGNTRVAIYPPFMVIGKLFCIGKNYPVEGTIDLVKEKGKWRVSQEAFAALSF